VPPSKAKAVTGFNNAPLARSVPRADRMHAKRLITDRRCAQMVKSAEQAGFHCEAAVDDLSTEAGRKRLIELMLLPREKATPEFVDAVYEESRDARSSFSKAMLLVKTDAYPDAPEEPEGEGEQSGPKAGTSKT